VPVAVVEPEPAHRRAEQFGVHPLGPAAAVLVGLDLDQGGLRRSVQARDAEAVRVRLLELVDRPVQDELTELAAVGVPVQVRRQARALVVVDEFPEQQRR
jgi:hypothetical protein